MAVSIQIVLLWVVTPCRLLHNHRYTETYYLHLMVGPLDPGGRGRKFLHNFGNHLHDYTVPKPKRVNSHTT
jgi:hypothetical protein